MDHNELAERLERKIDERFNRLEQEVKASLEISTINKTDISWLKSFVKTSVGICVTFFIGIATSLFTYYSK